MENLLQKLMLGGSTAALFAAMPVMAQAQDASSPGDIEQVVVSASRVTIAGYTQPTPVTVVGAAQLEKDAYANITDAVRNLPQVNSPPSSVGNENGGASQGSEGENILNLRSLGVIRTLVLFDSQRVVAANITGGVDVGVLPSAVVSRVDVVTGGASAAWGSDAVAGVVNFVLNKNYTGFKATIEASDDERNTYRGVQFQGAWGDDIFGGRGHLVLAGDMSMHPDVVTETTENWYRNSYLVSNPAYAAGNGQPQFIVANDVGIAEANQGGIIVSSPAGTVAGAGTANALRGIEFVGQGNTQQVNFGNLTAGVLSNGGSLTTPDGEQEFTIIAQPNNVATFFGFARYKLTDTIQASLQLNYGYFSGKDFAQPNLQTALVIKSDNAYLPASVRAAMQAGGISSFTMGTMNFNNFNPYANPNDNYFQQAEAGMGVAVTKNQRQMMRGVFTLEGTIGDDWSWNAYYEHSTVRFWSHVWGNAISANLIAAQDAVTVTAANRGTSSLPVGSIACRSSLPGQAAVISAGNPASAGCIPLDVFGNGVASPGAIRYITGGSYDYEDMQTNQDVAEGSMQGTLPWELPAGKVAVAFGAGYRKEAGVNRVPNTAGWITSPGTVNAVNQTGNANIGELAGLAIANYTPFGSAIDPATGRMSSQGEYNVMEGFAEVDAPIIKNGFVNSLDFSGAGRMTSYSTSGLVETWKLGLTSQVNDDVRLRTTWSVDIRAPSLTELFQPYSINNGSSKDPKTGVTQQVFTNVIGNPNLNPEIARTISGGVVLTPTFIPGLSFSADWYNINLTGEILSLSSQLILNTCTTNINDPLCSHLVFGGAGGALSGINNAPINVASLRTSGMDLSLNYTMDFWEGSLAWAANANYQDEITQTQPGTTTDDYAGVMGSGGPSLTTGTPKWKGILSADYTTGPYSFTVQTRWYGTGILNNAWGSGNLATAATSNIVAVNEVPFTAYLDLRASYKWNDNIQLYGAVDNATDVPPPLVPLYSGNVIHATPTSISSYDLLGRVYRMGVRFNY
jgi:outer membrane receptor protein involved in Fe transport